MTTGIEFVRSVVRSAGKTLTKEKQAPAVTATAAQDIQPPIVG